MRSDWKLLLLMAAAFAAANAQDLVSMKYKVFPFCNCPPSGFPYSLSPPKDYGNGKYCFTLLVDTSSSTEACARAGLYKIEFNVNPACDKWSLDIKATINGNFSLQKPDFHFPASPPAPPVFSLNIPVDQCRALANKVVDEFIAQAEGVGARLLSPLNPEPYCEGSLVKVCLTFASNADAEKLEPYALTMADTWAGFLLDSIGCPSEFSPFNVVVSIRGDGTWPDAPASKCLNAEASRNCKPLPIRFPPCNCTTTVGATPFALLPYTETVPGTKKDRVQYCFRTAVVQPNDPNSRCGSSDTLAKIEFWANETMRRSVLGVYVRPSDADTFRYIAPSWAAVGEQTFKVTPLRWSKAQADGGKVCLEFNQNVDLSSFCLTNSSRKVCWMSLFSPDNKCCPLFLAASI
ncbi:hypothetical protein VOLCADRAFT_106285 [Volvox carteri f. nagariensis]|uniref:Pherophorin domain-containing protein n=1 Tax=Volvox carteri f. nagariensis TaxID=3068 RepID=D8U6C5_VOLCA|nr:uncharacterized protein VOLCADRAFT_106285 [Volvox carteri f. nagariensis]EFJ44692.1 hypothetical protein VOLCADRAFT_106285 [Volvox carteri f. nagariensis]|eukprot:XP_002954268.1 hypothetical protein VOLCADRAFT_106285 [Volvox carteri f. nagariensis]